MLTRDDSSGKNICTYKNWFSHKQNCIIIMCIMCVAVRVHVYTRQYGYRNEHGCPRREITERPKQGKMYLCRV